MFMINDEIEVYLLPFHSGEPVICWKTKGEEALQYWGNYGIGEGCLMNSLMTRNENMVLLYDVIKKQIWAISFIESDAVDVCGPMDTNIKSQCIIPITDKKGMYLNPNSFKAGRKRILQTEEGYQMFGCRKSRHNYINVLLGTIASDESNQNLVYADRVLSRIEFMDERHHKKNIVSKESLEEQKYYVDSQEVTFSGSVYQSFVDICAYRKGVAVVYRPGIIYFDREEVPQWSDVFLFDWKGSTLARYRIDAEVINISLSYNGNCMWCYENKLGNKQVTFYELEN